MADELDMVLDRLVKDVEASVHALYRGDMRQNTAKARTGGLARAAAEAIRAATRGAGPDSKPLSGNASAVGGAPSVASIGWTREESEVVTKCVLAWLSMGAPSTTAPETKCIAAGREMVPTWGERERARAALRRVAG